MFNMSTDTMTPNPAPADVSAVEVLRSLEWSGCQNTGDGRTLPCCPTCRKYQFDWSHSVMPWLTKGGQHAPDCRLAAALAAPPSSEIADLRAEIGRLRDLFRKDGDDHARTVKDLTERHEARITKYAERIAELRAERDAANDAIMTAREVLSEAGISMPFLDDGVRALLQRAQAAEVERDALLRSFGTVDLRMTRDGVTKRFRAALSQNRTENDDG